MPNPLQTKMEDMSIAYLQAICAKNGYELSDTKHDNDCVDYTINCGGYPIDDAECVWRSPKLEVQLKFSFSSVTILENGDVQYDIPARNYNYLVDTHRFTPYILVLLVMHRDEELWLEQNIDGLKITKCAYWISLKGQEPTENKNSIRIVIPGANVLTPNALKKIMVTISKQQEL